MDQQIGSGHRSHFLDTFFEIYRDLLDRISAEKPENICEFSAQFFESKVSERDEENGKRRRRVSLNTDNEIKSSISFESSNSLPTFHEVESQTETTSSDETTPEDLQDGFFSTVELNGKRSGIHDADVIFMEDEEFLDCLDVIEGESIENAKTYQVGLSAPDISLGPAIPDDQEEFVPHRSSSYDGRSWGAFTESMVRGLTKIPVTRQHPRKKQWTETTTEGTSQPCEQVGFIHDDDRDEIEVDMNGTGYAFDEEYIGIRVKNDELNQASGNFHSYFDSISDVSGEEGELNDKLSSAGQNIIDAKSMLSNKSYRLDLMDTKTDKHQKSEFNREVLDENGILRKPEFCIGVLGRKQITVTTDGTGIGAEFQAELLLENAFTDPSRERDCNANSEVSCRETSASKNVKQEAGTFADDNEGIIHLKHYEENDVSFRHALVDNVAKFGSTNELHEWAKCLDHSDAVDSHDPGRIVIEETSGDLERDTNLFSGASPSPERVDEKAFNNKQNAPVKSADNQNQGNDNPQDEDGFDGKRKSIGLFAALQELNSSSEKITDLPPSPQTENSRAEEGETPEAPVKRRIRGGTTDEIVHVTADRNDCNGQQADLHTGCSPLRPDDDDFSDYSKRRETEETDGRDEQNNSDRGMSEALFTPGSTNIKSLSDSLMSSERQSNTESTRKSKIPIKICSKNYSRVKEVRLDSSSDASLSFQAHVTEVNNRDSGVTHSPPGNRRMLVNDDQSYGEVNGKSGVIVNTVCKSETKSIDSPHHLFPINRSMNMKNNCWKRSKRSAVNKSPASRQQKLCSLATCTLSYNPRVSHTSGRNRWCPKSSFYTSAPDRNNFVFHSGTEGLKNAKSVKCLKTLASRKNRASSTDETTRSHFHVESNSCQNMEDRSHFQQLIDGTATPALHGNTKVVSETYSPKSDPEECRRSEQQREYYKDNSKTGFNLTYSKCMEHEENLAFPSDHSPATDHSRYLSDSFSNTETVTKSHGGLESLCSEERCYTFTESAHDRLLHPSAETDENFRNLLYFHPLLSSSPNEEQHGLRRVCCRRFNCDSEKSLPANTHSTTSSRNDESRNPHHVIPDASAKAYCQVDLSSISGTNFSEQHATHTILENHSNVSKKPDGLEGFCWFVDASVVSKTTYTLSNRMSGCCVTSGCCLSLHRAKHQMVDGTFGFSADPNATPTTGLQAPGHCCCLFKNKNTIAHNIAGHCKNPQNSGSKPCNYLPSLGERPSNYPPNLAQSELPDTRLFGTGNGNSAPFVFKALKGDVISRSDNGVLPLPGNGCPMERRTVDAETQFDDEASEARCPSLVIESLPDSPDSFKTVFSSLDSKESWTQTTSTYSTRYMRPGRTGLRSYYMYHKLHRRHDDLQKSCVIL